MRLALWLLAAQGAIGAFDTLYYHEWRARLPARGKAAAAELKLHAGRDFLYAVIFCTLGWIEWNGVFAWVFVGLLATEIGITLWDFIEEDVRRKLPAGERVMHTIMGIVYGAFLAYLLPELFTWSRRPTAFTQADHRPLSWLLMLMGVGVFASGVRDLAASLSRASRQLPIEPSPQR